MWWDKTCGVRYSYEWLPGLPVSQYFVNQNYFMTEITKESLSTLRIVPTPCHTKILSSPWVLQILTFCYQGIVALTYASFYGLNII
jgi:hypothetical protein